ncbi:MAG: hypothetical protein ACYTG2_11545 [Planctomycetota bacterium]|jgi:hypothetical protein
MTRRDDAYPEDLPPDDAPDDETLDALRAAFGALPAPPPVRALSEEDETTQSSVAWVAAAWRALPVPEVPARPTLRPPAARLDSLDAARTRRRFVLRAAAAAALLVAALGLAWLQADRTDPATATPEGLAEAPSDEAPRALVDAQLDARLDASDAAAAGRSARRLVAATPDRLELTSGPVRLVLFTDVPDPTRETPR